jgi:hypothetical protein
MWDGLEEVSDDGDASGPSADDNYTGSLRLRSRIVIPPSEPQRMGDVETL